MSRLFIDHKAFELIKKAVAKENAQAVRIFISGGGCCKRFEIAPVKKALACDVTYRHGGIDVHVEKNLASNAKSIEITFDEKKGLLINFNQGNL